MLMMCLVVCDVAVTITCMFTLSPHPSLRGRQEESTKRRAHLYLIAGARYGRQQASGHIYIYICGCTPFCFCLLGTACDACLSLASNNTPKEVSFGAQCSCRYLRHGRRWRHHATKGLKTHRQVFWPWRSPRRGGTKHRGQHWLSLVARHEISSSMIFLSQTYMT